MVGHLFDTGHLFGIGCLFPFLTDKLNVLNKTLNYGICKKSNYNRNCNSNNYTVDVQLMGGNFNLF